MNQKSAFVISLDFELLWGVFDKVGPHINRDYFLNTRATIPRMLELFEAFGIQATWATVGMLFAANEEEWKQYQPAYKPSYRNSGFSAYEWAAKHGLDKDLHFAPELIQQILQTPGQELGSHTFAHYYTLMRGQTPAQFRKDLQAAQRIAQEKFGIRLRSLVFPRNHLHEQYFTICKEEGFDFVRGNPGQWYWQETQHESFLKKASRTIDCFAPIGYGSLVQSNQVYQHEGEPWVIPASRLWRPYSPKNGLINKLRLERIKQEMTHAAKTGQMYHLWWHPHNFGNHPQACLHDLQLILTHFQKMQASYGMESHSIESFIASQAFAQVTQQHTS